MRTPRVRNATMRGWTEEVGGHFRVTSKWFRTVTRVLSRQNYLSSTRQREDAGDDEFQRPTYRGYTVYSPRGHYRPAPYGRVQR